MASFMNIHSTPFQHLILSTQTETGRSFNIELLTCTGGMTGVSLSGLVGSVPAYYILI